ncbi:hypothetical protein EDD90_7092 [Streptomyces sp. Ag109_O5-1]|uniref:hypothetical protein n=1 Tax=Streptomyces sp. Ag109_O5-1 TaxID=1938851 RepID=UPI000F4FA624|nr:hypothetical protein [Streptomyces sp. Ag109_O5-1]RPE43876.1 hypothetical protein EDD90_7092 [Streptomyces sp. Ag109_O5-1]
MTPRRRLFVRLLLSAFADFVPLMLTMCVMDFVDDGIAWSAFGRLAGIPVAWALLALPWAAWRTGVLVRAARGLGIEASENALDHTQTYVLTGIPLALVRAELGSARRAFEVGEGNPVDFRWRPLRGRASADGTVTFDESSGEARVEVRAGKGLKSDVLLFQGAVFIALCQILRTLQPTKRAG